VTARIYHLTHCQRLREHYVRCLNFCGHGFFYCMTLEHGMCFDLFFFFLPPNLCVSNLILPEQKKKINMLQSRIRHFLFGQWHERKKKRERERRGVVFFLKWKRKGVLDGLQINSRTQHLRTEGEAPIVSSLLFRGNQLIRTGAHTQTYKFTRRIGFPFTLCQ
jgi:hypothetical protein